MIAQHLILSLTFATATSHSDLARSGYCELPCFRNNEKIENVICSHYPCMPSYMCGKGHKSLPLKPDEKSFILHLHNYYRDRVASGKEKRGGNGAASDMSVLSYDKELEFMASCWSNQCQEHPTPSQGRDDCRATAKFVENGQNYWANADESPDINWTSTVHVQRAVDSWYSGFELTSTALLSYFTANDSEYEFFTQLMWADTQYVGCGRTMFSSHTYTGINIVCNYSPTGNVDGESVYFFGKPCSRYEGLARNDFYTSLCGAIRPANEDRFLQPFKLSGGKASPTFGFVFAMCLRSFFVEYL